MNNLTAQDYMEAGAACYIFKIETRLNEHGDRIVMHAGGFDGIRFAESQGSTLGDCLIDCGLQMVGADWLDRLEVIARLLRERPDA